MAYFKSFPKVLYSFGDGEVAAAQNLAAYAEVLDQVKDNNAFYQQYHIITGERPDQVAFKLYKSADLYWTLFLVNDNLREQGWPLDQFEVLEKVKTDFPDYVIHTHDPIFSTFKVGQTIKCNRSGLYCDVVYRNIKHGDITVTNLRKLEGDQYVSVNFSSDDIRDGDMLTCVNTNDTLIAEYFTPEHLSARFHTKDGEIIDYLPFSGQGEGVVRVTHLDYYTEQNDKLKQINVLKQSAVNKLAIAFDQAVRT